MDAALFFVFVLNFCIIFVSVDIFFAFMCMCVSVHLFFVAFVCVYLFFFGLVGGGKVEREREK